MSRLPTSARSNIESILRLEAEQQQQATVGVHVADLIARFAGTITFVSLQLLMVALWIADNVNILPSSRVFDPFPFPLLAGLLSLESVLLTAFVLIRQNRMSRIADHRSHLDLQINLLSEQAITKVIQMLERMSSEMGIEERVTDAQAQELARETVVEEVSEELRTGLEATASGADVPG